MAYTDYQDIPNTAKRVICQIDTPLNISKMLTEEGGIWRINLTPGAVTIIGSDGEIGFYAGKNQIIYTIASLKTKRTSADDYESYTEVSTLSNLRAQNKSFLWDQGENTLYVHFDSFDPYYVFYEIIAGSVMGFSDYGMYSASHIYYDARLKSIPKIAVSKDPLFYGLLQFEGGSIEMENSDGYFDSLVEGTLRRQPIRLFHGFKDLAIADYKSVFSGFIETFKFNPSKIVIKAQDKRKFLTTNLPASAYNTPDYPNLDPDNTGEPVPLVFGSVRNFPLICSNEEEAAPASYEFILCDTSKNDMKSGQTVTAYVEDSEVTVQSFDNTTGKITIATADYTPGDKVTADFIGIVDATNNTIDNALDVIKYLMEEYADISYISDNFNTTEWAAETSNVKDIGLGLHETKSIQEIIEEICASTLVNFLVQPDGKYTARTYAEDRTPTRTIEDDEWLDDPEIDYPAGEFLSWCKVGYSKNWEANSYRREIIDTYRQEVKDEIGDDKMEDFPTLLVSNTDAADIGDKIMQRAKTIPRTIRRRTTSQHIDLMVTDFVKFTTKRLNGDVIFTEGIYEISSISQDLSDHEVEFEFKIVKDA